MCNYWQALAELELNVELYRQKLAALYDFEPFAAFCRMDGDKDKLLFVRDFWDFLRDNGRK